MEQCLNYGMKHVVCSPGSRNAPLVLAFDLHPEIKTYVIHDERSAAFFALGLAQELNAPVGVVCTSGSAALNYYPAIAEAFYQCVPLVVMTADRPAEWVNQGDGQTIVQRNVFQNHIRYAFDFNEAPKTEDELWLLEREIAVAFNEGTVYWKGPIHFNVGLNEPLYEKVENYLPRKARKLSIVHGKFELSDALHAELTSKLSSKKILLLCGQLPVDNALAEQIKNFSDNTSVAVLVENTSNLVDMRFVHCIDRTLNAITENEIRDFQPEILITVGGAVVSKRIKAFLRNSKDCEHWKVGFEFPYMDTFQKLSHSFQVEPHAFFQCLNQLPFERNTTNFGSKWKQKDFLVQDKLEEFFDKAEYADLTVFELILDYLPEMTHLHMANSSVVRYCQLFDPVKSIVYKSNRGTSGIDGSTSTAVGASNVNAEDLHVLITGDVSFFYDSNALWNRYLGPNLRIILINNGGGGIFRIIEGPNSSDQLEEYFEAEHSYEARSLAEAFNVEYYQANTLVGIEEVMQDFYSYDPLGRAKLLEIKTPRDKNATVLMDFFKQCK